ncbi:UNVERIFIED_CONTAM: Retrovirus-related Pol polyprotein from transposon TNT 1-94 [Sesamum latifolium]|uniref:Retrovirus-related Pol polyprotein from transposon TNT 1-94 n=1 Tax=Sesamum latifolium TaxID=2727402 RepID=A0AAW2WVP8_9LAMI
MVRDHLLASNSVPTLSNALSRVLYVATGSFESSSSSGTTTESSAMVVREWANTVNSGGEPAALEPEVVTLSSEEYEQLLYRPVANSATLATASSPGAFVASHGKSLMLDSGATTHLTGNRSHFSSLSISHNSLPVCLADGSYSPISCFGTDLQTRRTIGGGHERSGLYFLDTSTPADVRGLSSSVSPLQWLCRLGHPSLPSLKKILLIKLARLECESCELGKHHRASFPPRIEKCSSYPFTLVHSDSWGPCRFESIGRFWHFITFVDDYSRLTWVYLLKDRSQVYSRRTRSTTATPTDPLDLPPATAPGTPSATSANDIPIALRKVNLNWPMYQMDIKNAFLYGDLNETVYMEQPPGYVAQGEKQHMGSGMVILAVYVDDILITGSDAVGIEDVKTYLRKHFVTKDLGRPRYFLRIEIAHSKHGVSLSQRKYACDFLQEAGLLGTKSSDTLMDSNPDFWNDDVYWEAALRILKYIKASPGKGILFKRHAHVKIEAYSDVDYARSKDDRKSTSRYCAYVGGNLVTCRSKKQTTVARSSAEAEYRVMAHTTNEVL